MTSPKTSELELSAVVMMSPHQRQKEVKGPYFEAIVGVVIAVVILVLFLLLAVILRYMYKHKGTYHTNEAKGTEFAETADAALRGDPALQDAMDESKKEYFI
ncbi:Glycophorin-C [Labeo rohita]|uniref:Glycophorin-C n=1 Tax=Labeo rohita TaxID=84645 RepID=A0A498NEQ0_LABRO|nr:Glycophorin-C [Labeo rohita]